MISTPLLVKDKFEYLGLSTQVDVSEVPVNRALTHVAQTVMETLQHAYSTQFDASNHARTVSIRAIGSEYKQLITIEPLTARGLKVLQLIVGGDKNSIIAQKLCITKGTVKTHVRNILKKLCANDV